MYFAKYDSLTPSFNEVNLRQINTKGKASVIPAKLFAPSL
jgi:hypothetical protein